MTVSVIIPVRNMADTLPRAVESALEATEIVLIYDASTDNTFQVMQSLAQQYPNVRAIHPQSVVPVGVCAARNIGISLATGEWMIPLDADDWFLPGGIPALVKAYRPNTFVYGLWEDDTGAIRQPPPMGMLRRKNVVQATFLFARSDFIRVGGYDPRFTFGAEDFQLMRAFVRAGLSGTLVNQPVYHYTVHTNGRAADCHRRWPLVLDMLDEYYAYNPE